MPFALCFAFHRPAKFAGFAVAALLLIAGLRAADTAPPPTLAPGRTIELTFPDTGLPPTLHALMNGLPVAPVVTIRLPADYTPEKTFPLILYVPGNDGGPRGNIHNAETIATSRGWIAATLPLFKQAVDRTEPAGGVIVNYGDYAVLSEAYRILLGRVFDVIPNIDRARSAMVGFSNGAITLGVLLSHHDEFTLSHFRRFCLVDHGMFHLADLHRSQARGARYLLLVGDLPGMGRELKIRQAQLQQDAWRLLGVDLTCRVMLHTGHEFNAPQQEIVRDWLRDEPLRASQPPEKSGADVPAQP